MPRTTILLFLLLFVACLPAGPSTKPSDREWAQLSADYEWIQTLRNARKQPPANASRREQIEILLENHQKIEPTYVAFIDKLRAYLDRTRDPRAASLLAREKIFLGDEYMHVLSRYEKALELYRQALEADPGSSEALARIAEAERKRFVPLSLFSNIKKGMNEDEVRRQLGLPREDWIKQVVQNGRTYAVWIYPKSDGGASAVYFDNRVVYHTNWNAAAPPAR